VDVQKRMKAEVINPAKADRELCKTIKGTARVINRWIGQATNTQEAILRIVSCRPQASI
jgi:hypothetical protein